jgi:CTP synthase (UTP-ammonia lyase)
VFHIIWYGGKIQFNGCRRAATANVLKQPRIVRIMEMPDHAFFVGTLFVPHLQSTELVPPPFVSALLRAVLRRRTVRGADLQSVGKS